MVHTRYLVGGPTSITPYVCVSLFLKCSMSCAEDAGVIKSSVIMPAVMQPSGGGFVSMKGSAWREL